MPKIDDPLMEAKIPLRTPAYVLHRKNMYAVARHNALDDAMHQARWLNQILMYKLSAGSAFLKLSAERAAKVTP